MADAPTLMDLSLPNPIKPAFDAIMKLQDRIAGDRHPILTKDF